MESEYDYFGARYYDARVGRWGSIDPLLEEHFDFTPYNYVSDNPLFYVDPDGNDGTPAIRPHDQSYIEHGGGSSLSFSSYQTTTLQKAVRAVLGQAVSYGVSLFVEYFRPKSIFVKGKEGYLEVLGMRTEEIIISALRTEDSQKKV